jgi:hypothetical protein
MAVELGGAERPDGCERPGPEPVKSPKSRFIWSIIERIIPKGSPSMEQGLKVEPPRRVTPIDDPPPLAVWEPVLALEVDVPPVAVLLAVGVAVALLPAALERGAPPACGEPVAAWVWWCSGPGVAVAVPLWAVSFISAVSVGMNHLPSRKAAGGEAMKEKGLPEL